MLAHLVLIRRLVWTSVSCGSLFAAWLASPQLAVAQTAGASVNADPSYLPDDPTERDQEARNEFEKGRKAYDNGQYRDAWGYFHNAYKLSGRPELLYNIGQTADRLRMDADAVKAFRLYLERLPAAANRREVENRVRALEERMKENGDAPLPPDGSDSTSGEIPEPTPPPAPEPNSDAVAPPGTDQPRRQEWYLRAALGLGVRRDAISDDSSSIDGVLGGVGISGELALGYGILPGLVVGGGLFLDWASSPSVEIGGTNVNFDSVNLSMIGPMADWYVQHETEGWHVQAALALAVISFSRDMTGTGAAVGTKSATGGSLLLGGGYEWPLQEDWAIGALGRITVASLSADQESHGFFTASALCSLTWY